MKQKEWVYLAVFTFLVVAVWITYEVYHTYTTSTITEVEKSLMQPLDPKFDKETVIKIVEEN